jgi:hypothetical protein
LAALSALSVSEDEIQDALDKAIAECPEFTELGERLAALNERKAIFAARIAEAAARIDAATHVLTSARLTQIELQRCIAEDAGALSPEGLRYARAMRDRALERLLRFQYYLRASYRYRFLRQPKAGDDNAVAMFNILKDTLGSDKTNPLTVQDFESIATAFREGLEGVANEILTAFNEIGRDQSAISGSESTISIELSDLQLATLNRTQSLLLDPMELGKLHLRFEDMRIFDLKIAEVELSEFPDRPVDVKLQVHHLGVSQLRKAEQQFRFRTAPETWGAVIRTVKGAKPIQDRRNQGDVSLIRSLAKTQDTDYLFPQPAAWAPLRIEPMVMDMVTDYVPKFRKVTLIIQYTAKKIDGLATLYVALPDGIQPVIQVTKPDRSHRKNGKGSFLRTYVKSTKITLSAPETYGQYKFKGWRVRQFPSDFDVTTPIELTASGTQGFQGDPAGLITGTDITLTLEFEHFVRPIFVLPAAGASGDPVSR